MLSKNEKYILLLSALLIVLGMMMLILSHADAKNKKHRRPDPVVIVNNADPRWDYAIQETIKEFNDAMPKNGPNIKLVRGEVVTCQSIDICSGELDHRFWGIATTSDPRNGRIWLQDGGEFPPTTPYAMEMVVCHEMMHALTGILDNYGALPNDSCVWGYRDDLGSFDIERIKRKFGK